MSYRSAHEKVSGSRGKASEHQCLDCGVAARHWAFRYTSASDLRDKDGRPYSLDPSDYDPLCIGCHRRRDLAEDERVATAARQEGKRMGDTHAQRLAEDPEFALRRGSDSSKIMTRINTDPEYAEVMWVARDKAKKASSEAAVRTSKARRSCGTCGLIAPPGPMGTHLRYSGHVGWVGA